MKCLRAFAVAAAALCCTKSAAAQDVTITFHGTISDVSYSPFPDVYAGVPFAGAFTYSMSTPDTNPIDGVGDYFHKGGHYGVTVTIASQTFHTDRFNPDFLVELDNDFLGEDDFLFISYNNSPSDGYPVSMIDFSLRDFTMTAMNDPSLTGPPPDPRDLNSRLVSLCGVPRAALISRSMRVELWTACRSAKGRTTTTSLRRRLESVRRGRKVKAVHGDRKERRVKWVHKVSQVRRAPGDPRGAWSGACRLRFRGHVQYRLGVASARRCADGGPVSQAMK